MESSAESGTGASGPHRGERDGNRTRRRRESTLPPSLSTAGSSGLRAAIPHHTRPPSPARPTTVSARPTQSTVAVVKLSFTCLLVGTTTMKLGVARHGPFAPSACQFGYQDVFTITGTPVRDTSNSTDDSVVRMFDTSTGGSACFFARRALAAGALIHDAGPSSVIGRSSAFGSENHGTALHSHGLNSAWVSAVSAGFGTPSHFHDGSDCIPVATTGWYGNAWTVGESFTR